MGDFLDFPALQDPQEFGLHGKRQFSDFIQKNGARVRHFKFSGNPSGFGSGEGPCVISEQLRLHKLLGSAAQFTVTKGLSARGLAMCRAWATNSLPVPDSP